MAFVDVPIDAVRDYWDRRPCNIRHSAKPVGTIEYFDEVERRKHFVEPHISGFAQFNRWEGKRVLEVGCGIGTDTIRFARAGALVTAVDLSEASLAIARRGAQVFGLDGRVTFYLADAEELSASVPLDAYDLIYSFGVLHHTPRPERALAQLRKYARPGTELKLMMYNRWSWKALTIAARGGFRNVDELIARHSEAQTGCPVTYVYDRRSLAQLVAAQGFQAIDMSVDHIFPWRVADYVNYRYRREWYWSILPASAFRALERRLGWHLCVTAVAEGPRYGRALKDAGGSIYISIR